MHYEPAMMAIEKQYDILLEKPIAPMPEECYNMAKSANEKKARILVCHVLRYTPFYKAVKEFVSNGRLGDVVNIIHSEGVGNFYTTIRNTFLSDNSSYYNESLNRFKGNRLPVDWQSVIAQNGNQIKARSKAEQTFLIQLSCAAEGYLPTEKAELGIHYSAFVLSGVVGHEGGVLLVRNTLDEINKMFWEEKEYE